MDTECSFSKHTTDIIEWVFEPLIYLGKRRYNGNGCVQYLTGECHERSSIQKLQRVQNTAARVVLQSRR